MTVPSKRRLTSTLQHSAAVVMLLLVPLFLFGSLVVDQLPVSRNRYSHQISDDDAFFSLPLFDQGKKSSEKSGSLAQPSIVPRPVSDPVLGVRSQQVDASLPFHFLSHLLYTQTTSSFL